MGEIFLAEEDETGRKVAIKRLLAQCAKDPVFIGMFLDEARLVELLEHDNVCEVYEHGQEGRHYYLVMEYIDGVSLRDLLESRSFRGLPFPLAARIIAEVASGLDYAHRFTDEDGRPLGIVHRDVSPANIMIARDGRVKLVDFGLARARTQIMKTQPGLVKGKFGYLAPEQLAGRIDWRTDLFALGLCTYEAIVGRQLFDQRTAAQTVQAIQRFEGPPPIGDVPSGFQEVLSQVLSVDPAARQQSAAAFRSDLGRVVLRSGHGAVSARALADLLRGDDDLPPDGPIPEPSLDPDPATRTALPILLAVFVVAAIAVLALILSHG